MTFWQTKWRAMNGFRRMILAVLALMLAGFGAAMAAAQTRFSSISDGEGRLTPKPEGELLVYSGRLDGGQVRLTVQPDGTAEYHWEALTYGPYQLESSPEAPASNPLTSPSARGVTIRQGDRTLFRGSYDPAPKNGLFTLVSDSAPLAENSRIPVEDAGQQKHAPRLLVLCQAALREELHQGDWAVFGLAALLTLLVMAWVLSSESVFQFRASLWSRATEGVEPSQLYTSMERLSWMVVTVLLALLYWMALTRIC